jgi:predicted Na+-dependent transporter
VKAPGGASFFERPRATDGGRRGAAPRLQRFAAVELGALLAKAMVVTFMLQAGLSVAPGLLAAEVRRDGRLARGVLFFLVAQPLLAVAVARALAPSLPVVVALVLLSAVGVAPLSARAAQKATGNPARALVLTLVLGVATVLTAPPTARLLLGYEGALDIDPLALELRLLALQAAPLGVGFALRAVTGRAALLARVFGAINLAALVGVVLLNLIPRLGALAILDGRAIAAGLLFSGGAVALGLAFEGPTFAAMANKPNVALALALVAGAGAPPHFAVSVVALFLLRSLVAVLVQVLFARRARRR